MTISTKPPKDKPIAIIGAGMAGLSCAHFLSLAGHSVHVFDKSRGPSGRMSTRRSNDNLVDWQCDHGAQYFTARDIDFRKQVAEWEQESVAAPWQARIGTHDGHGFKLQASTLERFVGTPRMTSPAAHMVRSMQKLPNPVRFQWQTTIQPLHMSACDEPGWSLHSPENGAELPRYQAVLIAVPAPQAVQLVATVSPEATTLSQSIRMRACWSLMVRCPQPVPLPVDGCFIENSPLRWIARDNSKPGRNGPETWLLHASHSWSQAHVDDELQTVITMLLEAFTQLGGPKPTSVKATAHRWLYADSVSPANVGGWWDPQAGLGLCGDWLQSGTVEGAWLSGRSLAQQVHSSLRSTTAQANWFSPSTIS